MLKCNEKNWTVDKWVGIYFLTVMYNNDVFWEMVTWLELCCDYCRWFGIGSNNVPIVFSCNFRVLSYEKLTAALIVVVFVQLSSVILLVIISISLWCIRAIFFAKHKTQQRTNGIHEI